jgi:hypothetical protein
LLEAKQLFLTVKAEFSSTILRAVDKYQLDENGDAIPRLVKRQDVLHG